jgi:hypothetical protein
MKDVPNLRASLMYNHVATHMRRLRSTVLLNHLTVIQVATKSRVLLTTNVHHRVLRSLLLDIILRNLHPIDIL